MTYGTTLFERSTYDQVLVVLPSHETTWVTYALNGKQRRIIRDAHQVIMNRTKGEHEKRCLEALKHTSIPPQRGAMSYFSKAHILRAASVIRSCCSVRPTAIITFIVLRGEEDEEKV